jgi:hypothetical protein
MGNSALREHKRALLPQNPRAEKGYSCYFHHISSFPNSIEHTSCTVLDHTSDFKYYTLRDNKDKYRIFKDIPYIYVSGGRRPHTWDDYFKIGTVVKRAHINNQNMPKSAEIVDVRCDQDVQRLVDLRDMKTGFTYYNVAPDQYFLDVAFCQDW